MGQWGEGKTGGGPIVSINDVAPEFGMDIGKGDVGRVVWRERRAAAGAATAVTRVCASASHLHHHHHIGSATLCLRFLRSFLTSQFATADTAVGIVSFFFFIIFYFYFYFRVPPSRLRCWSKPRNYPFKMGLIFSESVRDVIDDGQVHLFGSDSGPQCAAQHIYILYV